MSNFKHEKSQEISKLIKTIQFLRNDPRLSSQDLTEIAVDLEKIVERLQSLAQQQS